MNKHLRRSVIIFALSVEENFAENFLLWPFILIIQIVIAYFLFLRNYILIISIGTWNENFTIVILGHDIGILNLDWKIVYFIGDIGNIWFVHIADLGFSFFYTVDT